MLTFFKNIFNSLEYYFCYTRAGKIIASVCKPVIVAWIIGFFIFGVPLWDASLTFKAIVTVVSVVMGFAKAVETKQN